MREAFQADLQAAQARVTAAQQQLQQATGGEPAAPVMEVGSVVIRLPTFWTAAPELWFLQTEASLETRHPKITADSFKFNHILQALPQDVLMDCEVAINVDGANRYVKLKEALLKAYGTTSATKSAELLELNAVPGVLADRRPSTVLSKIRKLHGQDITIMERAMFLNQMSVEVRTSLASLKAANNDALSTEADAIHEELRLANVPGLP